MAVYVLDKHKQPLMPASEKRARLLLARGRAVVHKRYPFTIRLKDRVGGDCQPLEIKIDTGSKATGVAMVRIKETISVSTGEVIKQLNILNLFQLNHRGQTISESLTSRRGFRNRRRNCNVRYRQARFNNRTKKEGWLAPSIQHRVDSVMRLVEKLRKLAPITAIVQELVRFDMKKLENPEISGVEYQQGELFGFEVKEYLLQKFGHQCAYCDEKNKPLEVEHIHAKSTGGTNRVSNLTIACHDCNQAKDNRSVQEFLKHKPDRLKKILDQAKKPLKDAAAVNATRWALFNALKATGLNVTTGSGGLTKFNRKQHSIPKTHALDAACVGQFGEVIGWNKPVLDITCMGRGSYQRTRLDQYGFPRGYLMRQKQVHGFQTGDMVKATVTKGKKVGVYTGRIAIRANGYFNIQTDAGTVQGVSYKACKLIASNDGYRYQFKPKAEIA